MHRLHPFAAVALLAMLTTSAAAVDSPVESIAKSDDGVTLSLRPGQLKLQVCSDRTIRVSYSPTDVIRGQLDFVVTKLWKPVPFTVHDGAAAVQISTGSMQVTVAKTTGALTFADASGHVFLAETPGGGKTMTPATVNGESTYTVEQSFLSPDDEYLYGLSQAQDGIWNWRGMPIELRQQNTQTAMPILLSTKGYGLLWNNASLTEFNPVDEEVPLKLADESSKPGDSGPKATEQIDATKRAREAPPTLRTGTFTAPLDGDYVFFAKEGDRRKLLAIEVDGQRIGGVENFWVPYTTAAKVHLSGNVPHKVQLLGGGKNVKLFARPLGNTTTFRSQVGETIDYYVFYGPKLDDVIAGMRDASGGAPLWPKWAFGLWQCRERYSSQQQILDTVAEFRRRHIPLDLLVQDWQYWGKHGWGAYEWDQSKYPDPQAMIDALHAQHTKFMISVWSNPSGPVHDELAGKGLLIGDKWVDAFAPQARSIRWKFLNDAFFKLGTDAWWQDATEPGDDGNALNNVKTAVGSGNRVRNAYPLFANQTVYEGQRATTPDKRVVILTRSFFPGQQRYASALWSGDIGGTWDGFRRQIPAGLHASLAGVPYWTTDCGGFFRPKDQYTSDDYQELLVRWFEYSTFSPILRIHGYQSETEMWKFPKACDTLLKYDRLRYRLLPYNYTLGWQVTSQGGTIMRPLAMDFPTDPKAPAISDQYMHGPAFLVCPVTSPKAESRPVYLPGTEAWTNFWTGETASAGKEITASAPLSTIPLFVRAGSIIPLGPALQYAMESTSDPLDLRVYPGTDGSFTLYEDEGDNYHYEKGNYSTIPIHWNDRTQTLEIGARQGSYSGMPTARTFHVVWVTPGHGTGDGVTEQPDVVVQYSGEATAIHREPEKPVR